MRARDRFLVAGLVVALSASAPVLATAKGKKKKKAPAAVTKTASAPLAAGSSATATASCTGKSHATGGGLAVSPNYVPNSNTGLRSLALGNTPLGSKGWVATASAYTNPASSGALTTSVRCESNALGKIALRSSSSQTLAGSTGGDIVLNCPPGTHVISGGYQGDPPTNLASLNTFRIIILQSRRTGPGQWTVSGYNRTGAPTSTMTGHVVCELNRKGSGVREVSAFAPTNNDARTSADATCPKKTHVVSGGFLVSPATFPGAVPVVGIDETVPVGRRTWHVGIHEFPGAGLPPGSALQTVAYCKKG
jgi:hypothetical protein